MGRRVDSVAQGLNSRVSSESLSRSGKIINMHDCAKSTEMDKIMSESAALQDRVAIMTEKAKELRSQMEQYRNGIKAQKAANQQRKSDSESATYGLAERENKEFEFIEAGIKRTRRRWEMKHDEIVESRAMLCKPAARLAGLRRHRRPRENGTTREYFTIGSGIPIFDLRELHSKCEPFEFIQGILTIYSREVRRTLCLTHAPRIFDCTSRELLGATITSRDYFTPQRLSTPDDLPTTSLVSSTRCALPWQHASSIEYEQSSRIAHLRQTSSAHTSSSIPTHASCKAR